MIGDSIEVDIIGAMNAGIRAGSTDSTATVPVNLRQFFPSTSARNFFATVRVEHTYGEGADDVGSVSRQLDGQFRPKATPEALEKKLRRFIRFERTPVLRILPRPLKDLILKLVNWGSILKTGMAVRVTLDFATDEELTKRVLRDCIK